MLSLVEFQMKRGSMAWNPAKMKALRIKRKMTQKSLAAHIGITYQQIQEYERGLHEPGANRAHEIAKALGTSTSYLVDEVDDPDAVTLLADLGQDEREFIRAVRRGDAKAANTYMLKHARKQMGGK